jgi:crotonyl-CoA reductase
MIHPTMSAVYPLEKTGQAALDAHRNLHHGKVAVLCLARPRASGCAITCCGTST